MPERIDSFRGRYQFLSNFYVLEHPIVCEMRFRYYTVEHAYQAAKSLDPQDRRDIAAIPRESASKAKIAGRKILLRDDWEEIKRVVMLGFLIQKFTHNPDLRQLLLKTQDADLVEGNHWNDKYWGVCNGIGENYLGRLLTTVRKLLREE